MAMLLVIVMLLLSVVLSIIGVIAIFRQRRNGDPLRFWTLVTIVAATPLVFMLLASIGIGIWGRFKDEVVEFEARKCNLSASDNL